MYLKTMMVASLGLILSACGGGTSSSSSTSSSGGGSYSFTCSNSSNFTPSASPVSYTSNTTAASTTVIMLHGKSGSPYSSAYTNFYTNLQNAGYDIKSLYMPWGNNGANPGNWNGTLCQGMNYIDEIIVAEKNAGKKVVLIGHSLGATGAFIYNSTAAISKPDASIIIAPGHFMHKSTVLQTNTAASVSTANAMVKAGNGDGYATFQTYNGGTPQDVYTTANIFLSYHDLSQFPDIINNVLGAQAGPLYWIGGDADNLTNVYNYPSLFGSLPSNTNNKYETITGTHYTVVVNSSTKIINWLSGLKI